MGDQRGDLWELSRGKLAQLLIGRAGWVCVIVLALAMLVFGVLDIREVGHQRDESQTGLAILAGVIAALHLAAAATAGRRAQLARGPAG